MAGKRGTMSYEVERTMRTIFKRCKQCPSETPSCPPNCKANEICSLVPVDCNECAYMVCIANPNPAPKSNGPNVGAIAGGVVGGVAFMAVVVFCFYWFWIRKRRQQQEADGWVSEDEWEEEEDDIAQQKLGGERRFTAFKSQDALSTRTRGSVANSILSRASNIIQIAFIPGVTTRNGSGHNSLLNNSPVPPVPAAQRNTPRSPLSNQDDALFFRPGDLRDSTYSGTESLGSNRDTQYNLRHQSITPSLARSSVASSTVYRDDATSVPMPATQGVRAAARMISVRSNISGDDQASDSSTPTTAHVTTPSGSKKPVQILVPGQASPGPSHTNSIRSVASYGRPQQVSIIKGNPKRVDGPPGQLSREASDASFNTAHTSGTTNAKPSISSPLARYSDESEEEEEDDEHARGKQELIDTTVASPSSSATPLVQPVESPFFDASERPTGANRGYFQSRPNPYASMASSIASASHDRPKRGGRGMGGLSAVIEEATKRASRTGNSPSASQKSIAEEDEQGGLGPFADSHRASGGD
ncbi:hypothetical protein K431DRAFT_305787 [Polychaeton citri CBS 116435]|uniref:Membrane anchor Opy2 N-terminal domain-containing protein n=1 Tax=Polychaeton citri CBS 116435 TaxID=1314669 RepID=A0A9P4Q5F1_9PEZI|nr:hypothetical protein K431DRAFT_305787 [Polychaeton citri CBS 116435]